MIKIKLSKNKNKVEEIKEAELQAEFPQSFKWI